MSGSTLLYNVRRLVDPTNPEGATEYVQRCDSTPPGYKAAQWTTDRTKARSFSLNVATAVARRNSYPHHVALTCSVAAPVAVPPVDELPL